MTDPKRDRGVMSSDRKRLTPSESALRELFEVEKLTRELHDREGDHRASQPSLSRG